MKDLVLDNEGARIAGQMQQIGEAMQQLVMLLQDHELMYQAKRDDLPEHGEQLFAHVDSTTEAIQQTLGYCRTVLATLGEGPTAREFS